MKTRKLSDLVDEEMIARIDSVAKRMFAPRVGLVHNAWVRDFVSYENFYEKLSKCVTLKDVNALLNTSWTGTACHVCGKEADVVVIEGTDHALCICKNCLAEASAMLEGENNEIV